MAVNKIDDEKNSASKDDLTSGNEVIPKFVKPDELNIDELVIPEDFMFKEEFEILKYMSKTYPGDCSLTHYEPVSITEIVMCEQRMGIKFTDELKALYSFTNGMDFSMNTLGFDFLGTIESMYRKGYCDFEKEGDAEDYVIVGGYLGGAIQLLWKRVTVICL